MQAPKPMQPRQSMLYTVNVGPVSFRLTFDGQTKPTKEQLADRSTDHISGAIYELQAQLEATKSEKRRLKLRARIADRMRALQTMSKVQSEASESKPEEAVTP